MEANKRKFKKLGKDSKSLFDSHINNLDDGCLMHVFSFLTPIPGCPNCFCTDQTVFALRIHLKQDVFLKPSQTAIALTNDGDGDVEHHLMYSLVLQLDRYNTALVCHRWCFLACHPRLWLRVDRSVKDSSQPGVFPDIETAVSASRPGDTILIAAGGIHRTANIKIKKPLCLTGAGELPDDTTLICSRGSDSALEFLSTCKLTNLTVRAELGCCLLHRSGRLTIDGCLLQCESNPLDHLSHAIVTTATTPDAISSALERSGDCVSVLRTRIEGGAKAVLTSGTLSLQQVRVIYTRTSLFFWFNVESR